MISNADFNSRFQTTDSELLLCEKDREAYSVRKFLASICDREPLTGLEGEVSREAKKIRAGNYSFTGNYLPLEALGPKGRRDLQVGQFGAGGAMVGTEIARDPIALLLNKICCARLGSPVITGLTSNFAFPRITSPATPQSLPETGQAASSSPTMDQEPLTPHRVTVTTTFSKQLLIQASVDVETWLRSHLQSLLAVKFDALLIGGSGVGSEPLGIMNRPGVGSVTLGGAATNAKLVSMEGEITKMNADQPGSRLGYLVTPATRNKLKTAARELTGATTVSATSIWEDGGFTDGSNDGKVNGYRAASTNQVPGNLAIFGAWDQAILAMFSSGVDVVHDVFTLASTGQVKLTLTAYIDVAVLHPQSFCVSSDSAAQ